MANLSGLYLLRAHLALAFKTAESHEFGEFGKIYGHGFNAILEVGWTWTEIQPDEEFKKLVKKLDHRHLGLDAPELKITTPESLLRFVADYFLNINMPVKVVRLFRGEDIAYELKTGN